MARVLDEALDLDPGAAGDQRAVIDVSLLAPNTLLHDGHRWRRYPPERIAALARAAVRRARRADFLVHAGWHLSGAAEAGLAVPPALLPYVEAALEAERIVLAAGVPSCVVRLAYLYGPESRDLVAYRRAFRLGRPYWAGPDDALQRFVHTHDAARALLLAARQRPEQRVLSAHDHQPASFSTFMDHFAKLVGNPLPLHIPSVVRPLSGWLIATEHMDAVKLPTSRIPVGRQPRGFHPMFASYRSGLRDVVNAWKTSAQ
jgi:nucleoside-diphosphate-sugar epimerase